MSKDDETEEAGAVATKAERKAERRRVGQAIAALRITKGLTQDEAGARSRPPMTSQHWGNHETGNVRGIHEPPVLRKLLDAIGATQEELDRELMRQDAVGPAASRMSHMSRELSGFGESAGRPFDVGIREAVFPLRDGQVTLRFPADLSPGGFKELADYLAVFLKTNAPAND